MYREGISDNVVILHGPLRSLLPLCVSLTLECLHFDFGFIEALLLMFFKCFAVLAVKAGAVRSFYMPVLEFLLL